MGTSREKRAIHFVAQRSSGAILLHVLIATTIAGILLFSWWTENSLSYDIVIFREQHYKNRYMTDLLLSYGIDLIKKYKMKHFRFLDCNFIARLLGKDFGATLTLEDDVLYATLYKNGKKVYGVSCTVG